MSSILSQSAPQVFACQKCGEMINTSMAQCVYCDAPVDPRWASWAADAQATITGAFDYANNIMLAARGMVVLLIATLFPLVGILSGILLFSSIFAFPILILIWFSKYQWRLRGIDKNQDDLRRSRSKVLKAGIIYVVAIIAWPIILIIVKIVNGLLGVS